MRLTYLIHHLTVPCADNGKKFTQTEHINRTESLLASTRYSSLGRKSLAQLWQHPDFDSALPFLLVSSHIDSLYHHYHSRCEDGMLHGTYDNSITNAAILSLILDDHLPPQVLVAFTGDEEENSRGADQVMKILRKSTHAPLRPECVVVLDITEEGFASHAFTVENVFHSEGPPAGARLRFTAIRQLTQRLRTLLAPTDLCIIEEGEPDESWQYDEHNLNCFAFCLPCQTLTGDMHDDEGVRIKESSASQYTDTLARLLREIIANLSFSRT
jgi:hypothetical protein